MTVILHWLYYWLFIKSFGLLFFDLRVLEFPYCCGTQHASHTSYIAIRANQQVKFVKFMEASKTSIEKLFGWRQKWAYQELYEVKN